MALDARAAVLLALLPAIIAPSGRVAEAAPARKRALRIQRCPVEQPCTDWSKWISFEPRKHAGAFHAAVAALLGSDVRVLTGDQGVLTPVRESILVWAQQLSRRPSGLKVVLNRPASSGDLTT